jgi:CxxC motif-containing protein (DUF1111 family)
MGLRFRYRLGKLIMMVRLKCLAATGAVAFGVLVTCVWPGGAQTGDPAVGSPLPGLTAEQLLAFEAGKADFMEVHGIEQGLGPVFNGQSCAECHIQAAVGGGGDEVQRTSVWRFGKLVLAKFDPMDSVGGSLVQKRSINELDPSCTIPGESIPLAATIRARRVTTPLFGAGLIEALPASAILARDDPDDADLDGISGRAHALWNPDTQRVEIGRFGWKAQHSSLHAFSGEAYLNEMGITSPGFPMENLPQGKPIPTQWSKWPVLDDDGAGVANVTAYMRFLAQPPRGVATTQTNQGQQLFQSIGCASCHTPTMRTASDHPVAALRARTISLYSDLLLHDMGTLADRVVQGNAHGAEFRTPPLWGVGLRTYWLHDGRATNLHAAINLHDGEAADSRAKFKLLTSAQQAAIVAFLRIL